MNYYNIYSKGNKHHSSNKYNHLIKELIKNFLYILQKQVKLQHKIQLGLFRYKFIYSHYNNMLNIYFKLNHILNNNYATLKYYFDICLNKYNQPNNNALFQHYQARHNLIHILSNQYFYNAVLLYLIIYMNCLNSIHFYKSYMCQLKNYHHFINNQQNLKFKYINLIHLYDIGFHIKYKLRKKFILNNQKVLKYIFMYQNHNKFLLNNTLNYQIIKIVPILNSYISYIYKFLNQNKHNFQLIYEFPHNLNHRISIHFNNKFFHHFINYNPQHIHHIQYFWNHILNNVILKCQ